MKLAIADPPYLGRAYRWYGDHDNKLFNSRSNGAYRSNSDKHADAAAWDDPATHQQMLRQLESDYDGWAVAMHRTSLRHYLQWVDDSVHIAVWHNTTAPPTGNHVQARWEPVLVRIPASRKKARPGSMTFPDVLTAHTHDNGSQSPFVGYKPHAWTRWVLDMLGYDPDTDTVDDMFPGSGSVTRALNAAVMF